MTLTKEIRVVEIASFNVTLYITDSDIEPGLLW